MIGLRTRFSMRELNSKKAVLYTRQNMVLFPESLIS